jgi:hypothetical protein
MTRMFGTSTPKDTFQRYIDPCAFECLHPNSPTMELHPKLPLIPFEHLQQTIPLNTSNEAQTRNNGNVQRENSLEERVEVEREDGKREQAAVAERGIQEQRADTEADAIIAMCAQKQLSLHQTHQSHHHTQHPPTHRN